MLLLKLLISSFAATAVAQSTVTVRDNAHNLTYVGFSFAGTEQFQGINFGQDTSGANRFKPPKAFTYPNGTTVQATAAGAACPQNTILSFLGAISENPGVFNVSEDCLNLEVVRPAGTKQAANLPVMVWISGQGDEEGSYNYSLYNPTALVAGSAAKGTPVVYVSMNYRVNVFGFANSPALKTEGSLNAGLLDQRLALQWVQSNIATFGGNPKNVTIFGESDGGTSVGLHITSFGGNGTAPFRRAIMQSGSPAGDPGVTGNATVTNTAAVAQLAGCTGTNSSLVLTCLRQIPMVQLLNAVLLFENSTTSTQANGVSQDLFFPTVDGSYVPAAPSTLIRTGRFHKNISIIAGWNENDGSIFAPPTLNGSTATQAFLHSSYPHLNSTTLSSLTSLYPISDFVAAAKASQISPFFLQASQIYRDINFACPAIDVAHRVTQFGSASYLYVLNTTSLTSVLQLFNATFEGVIHFSDVPFVFDQPNVGFGTTAAANLTATRMSGSWAHFASTGNPSGNSTITLSGWTPAYNKSQAAVTSQNVTGASVRIIGGPNAGQAQLPSAVIEPQLLHRCAFINSPAFYQQLQT
ncbi:uncharacterized protein Z520_06762 [Fonsecaea multimorphosa CBS 102226]|uniref:Carboxylesterase type B domain-containing protein n=1 Tax=Fonsecaea multimorphosa CBS 102226 TaxID=1442371 RepID=A0A0D2H638_9EURO|nr:uncharacterized protein Z520_06762 [Fonsecaea multimorphosa CBS 102226]KIX97310.1 hypothetical protein Z520_06762 [Fonsecaea multimorphosa CBS 102226]OAL23277.1 hypothetical protein AYO22_06327 [Fonsecaea multimorphosa]